MTYRVNAHTHIYIFDFYYHCHFDALAQRNTYHLQRTEKLPCPMCAWNSRRADWSHVDSRQFSSTFVTHARDCQKVIVYTQIWALSGNNNFRIPVSFYKSWLRQQSTVATCITIMFMYKYVLTYNIFVCDGFQKKSNTICCNFAYSWPCTLSKYAHVWYFIAFWKQSFCPQNRSITPLPWGNNKFIYNFIFQLV